MSSPTTTPWAPLPSSTSSATVTSLSQDTSQNNGYNGGGGGGGGSAVLYLYTFLATLIVLVSVSVCILARLLLLRGRRRRQIAQMLAADPALLPPGWVDGVYHAFPRRRDEGELRPPPVMRELWVAPGDEKTAWAEIMPLNTTKPATTMVFNPSAATSSPAAASTQPRGRFRRHFFPAPLHAPAAPPAPVTHAVISSHPDTYTVAVMIAMPDAARESRKLDDDGDMPPPYVEFGLVHAPLPAGNTAS